VNVSLADVRSRARVFCSEHGRVLLVENHCFALARAGLCALTAIIVVADSAGMGLLASLTKFSSHKRVPLVQ